MTIINLICFVIICAMMFASLFKNIVRHLTIHTRNVGIEKISLNCSIMEQRCSIIEQFPAYAASSVMCES